MSESRICSQESRAAAIVSQWLLEEPPTKTLLALDAPLGWPLDLASISNHSAGAPIIAPAHRMFRRETDRFIKQRLGQQSLDVGADRIARTAHAALALLEEVRGLTGETIPLAWGPSFVERVAAIEVYPAATLRAHRMQFSKYKKPAQIQERRDMLAALSPFLTIPQPDLALQQADVLDAIVCVLAGADFQAGKCMSPLDALSAVREGWIWASAPE